jgi:hypothetical protein
VIDLAFAALSNPQTAFSGLQKSLRHKWQFIQRAIEDIGDCFFDIEEAITDISCYQPFMGSPCRTVTTIAKLKFAGLVIPDPSATSETNYKASTLVCSHLLAAFRGVESFSSTYHKSVRKLRSQLNSSQVGLRSLIQPLTLSSVDWTVILAKQFYPERRQGNG